MNTKQAIKDFGDWAELLQPYIETKEFDKFEKYYGPKIKTPVFPSERINVFKAFRETSLKSLRVLILGNEPYTLPGFSDGLAFSTNSPNFNDLSSQRLFLNAIVDDCLNKMDESSLRRTGDLSYLCAQGVGLLNTALTVRVKKIGGLIKEEHNFEHWMPFTKFVIAQIAQLNRNVIFVAIGKQASEACSELDRIKHGNPYLQVEHPNVDTSPGPDGNRSWKHENIFTRINEIIRINKLDEPIDWLPGMPKNQD